MGACWEDGNGRFKRKSLAGRLFRRLVTERGDGEPRDRTVVVVVVVDGVRVELEIVVVEVEVGGVEELVRAVEVSCLLLLIRVTSHG